MKKLLIAIAFMASAAVAMAQGTVTFQNRDTTQTPPIDAPVFDVDGTTALSGAAYLAQLYYAPVGSSTFVSSGDAVIFRTGTRAGYVDNTVDLTRTLAGITAGGNAQIQVRAWLASGGATYEAALGKVPSGISSTITVATGGAGSPPGLPTALLGLQSFHLNPVPEPTTIALGLLGAGALFLRRRK